MSDESFNYGALFKDLRVWLGAALGVTGSVVTLMAAGGEVLEAPEEVAEVRQTADSAFHLATANNEEMDDLSRSIRIVFCTKKDWLSAEAAAQLECWRIRTDGR